ncbi:hypothetical protein QUF80_24380, partial [Desulfococcaceae bacterium HSG8]|nr:hypothetical protein [Desulfococcaceae bacterium HSG8]
MNTKIIKSLFIMIFTCLLAIPDSTLCAKEIINWYVNDFPPGYILKEPFREQGFNDIQQKLIIRQMKDYEHITKISSLSRALVDMKAGENVCFVSGIYQLNNEYLISSIPFYHLPVHSIIISGDNRHLFPSDDKISLKNLLQNKDLVFGMPSGRNYGEYIDPIINEFKGQPNIYIRTGAGSDDNEGLVKMLLAG